MTERVYDYRAEMFAADDGCGPYWVSVEAPDGHARTEAEVLLLVSGPFEFRPTARRVKGRIEEVDRSWWFEKADDGPLDFWELAE